MPPLTTSQDTRGAVLIRTFSLTVTVIHSGYISSSVFVRTMLRAQLGEAFMDMVERSFAVAAMTGFMVLVASSVALFVF